MRILLIEDTEDLGDAIQCALRRAGHAVDWARSGEEGQELLACAEHDALILDVMLPGMDGFSLLSQLRQSGNRIPVLIITARSEIDDKVSLLDLGADDHMVKPFDLRELTARMRALTRRPPVLRETRLQWEGLVLDSAARAVEHEGQPLALLRQEFRLLELLMARPGALMRRERLVDGLFSLDESVAPNALEVQISRLRKKLAPVGIQIDTHRGEGYSIRRSEAE